MQFTKIDINNWTRKEYFDHYFDNTPCTYSMTVKLDISKLKKDGKKLYPTLLYGVTTILNRHEEFRTALDKNGQVGVFSEMLPCYTIFHKETETFSSIWTEFTADYTEFLQNYQKDIDAYGERKGMFAKPNPPENTFPVSMIPWTSFEGFELNILRLLGTVVWKLREKVRENPQKPKKQKNLEIAYMNRNRIAQHPRFLHHWT